MICPDINLLLYAVHVAFPRHPRAKSWWDGVLSGSDPVSLLPTVALGFVRLSTSPKVFQQPLTITMAVSVVDGWLAQPLVRWVGPGSRHWDLLKRNLECAGTVGNLATGRTHRCRGDRVRACGLTPTTRISDDSPASSG